MPGRERGRAAASILKPDRPERERAEALVAGVTDVEEAWARLSAAGLAAATAHPATVAHGVLLASDPSGVRAAEAHALELGSRLAAWQEPRPDRVEWTFDALEAYVGSLGLHVERPAGAAAEAARLALRAANLDAGSRRGDVAARLRFPDAAADLDNAATWAAARAADLAIPHWEPNFVGPSWPDELIGSRFAMLPDPFAPLLAIWRLGYAVVRVDESAIVLLTPPPSSPATTPPRSS
jgi:hypothetical protein